MDAKFIRNKLGSSSKFMRDTALEELAEAVNSQDHAKLESARALVPLLVQHLGSNAEVKEHWELYHGCLSALAMLITNSLSSLSSEDLVQQTHCLNFLDHEEQRLRIQIGLYLQSLCTRFGPEVCNNCLPTLIQLINDRLDSHFEAVAPSCSNASNSLNVPIQDCILESSVKILQLMVCGCYEWKTNEDSSGRERSDAFFAVFTPEFVDLLYKLATHKNVRIRISIITIIGNMLPETEYNLNSKEDNPVLKKSSETCSILLAALSDDNHANMVACECAGEFIEILNNQSRSRVLLPPLCLLRYSMAEGVRSKAIEAWRLAVGQNGPALVEEYLEQFVAYYLTRLQSPVFIVRQSCCHAIVELFRKINRDRLRPHVTTLVNALLERLSDESTQVKDCANLAFGECVAEFPEDCAHFISSAAIDRLFMNLSCNIYMVRSGAAQTLAKIIDIYTSSKVVNSEIFLELNTTLLKSVIPRIKSAFNLENDDQQKNKQTVEWLPADGCLQLLAEMTAYPGMAHTFAQLYPNIVSASFKRNYPEHVVFMDTLVKRLPAIARGLGKNRFKSVVDDFIEPVFYSTESNCPQLSSDAADCVRTLASFLGPNIFRAKVERCKAEFVPLYDRITSDVTRK